jgi:hypothetical protein
MSTRWYIAVLAVALSGCREPPATKPGPEAPATTTTSAPAREAEPGRMVVRIPGARHQGWLVIDAAADSEKEAFAEARLVSPSHLVVRTRNVERLRLELGQLKGRSPSRLILRIDDQGIEITGARGMSISLIRSKTGAWNFAR